MACSWKPVLSSLRHGDGAKKAAGAYAGGLREKGMATRGMAGSSSWQLDPKQQRHPASVEEYQATAGQLGASYPLHVVIISERRVIGRDRLGTTSRLTAWQMRLSTGTDQPEAVPADVNKQV